MSAGDPIPLHFLNLSGIPVYRSDQYTLDAIRLIFREELYAAIKTQEAVGYARLLAALHAEDEPEPQHDGKLSEDYQVAYQAKMDGKSRWVALKCKDLREQIGYKTVELLEPAEALSLLAWLEQEEERLRHLVKEQAHE